jgi:hypothetical protein
MEKLQQQEQQQQQQSEQVLSAPIMDTTNDRMNSAGQAERRWEQISPHESRRRRRNDSENGSEVDPRPLSTTAQVGVPRPGAPGNYKMRDPKLLRVVEDAIKRLILPELNAMKEEREKEKDKSSSAVKVKPSSGTTKD